MNASKRHVVLISGGRSGEREVSINSGRQVAQALDPDRYTVTHNDPATELDQLMALAPEVDVALIVLHGRYGEDGTIQGLLELLGVPYQGSGVLSSALCMDKRASKDIYRLHGFLTPKDVLVDRQAPPPVEQIVQRLGLPLVIKPACEGSSLGVTIARDEAEAADGLDRALACGRWVLAEEKIEGREITGAVLGNDELEALPLIEIQPKDQYTFFNYEAKYVPGASREICPAPLPEDLTAKARQLAAAAHRALYCRGYSRTDFILQGDDFYVLETNTLPGLTQTSLLPQAAAAGGYDFPALIDRLIDLALEDAAGDGK